MNQRFVMEKKHSYIRNLLISLAVFAAVFLVFYFAVSSVSDRTREEELQTLKTAVTRDITHCYAVEGSYPKSLEYLKENYGLTYDEDKYFVDYQPMGMNIMPDVTIMKRTNSKISLE